MAIFSPISNFTIYEYFDTQIYELALKNNHICDEKKKFLKEGKLIIDDLIKNNKSMYFYNLINSEKFKVFFKKLFVTCIDGLDSEEDISMNQKFKYDLKATVESRAELFFLIRKLTSSVDITSLEVNTYLENNVVLTTEIPSNYEGYVLFIFVIMQYLLEIWNLMKNNKSVLLSKYNDEYKVYIGDIISDEFYTKYLTANDMAGFVEAYNLFETYFVVKYSLYYSRIFNI